MRKIKINSNLIKTLYKSLTNAHCSALPSSNINYSDTGHLKTSKKPSPCFLTVWCIKLKDLWLLGGGLTHEQGNMSITFEGQGSGDINL